MNTDPAIPALLDLFLKSSAILALAIFAGLILRRASASNRHVIWMAALAALLLMPLTKLAVPRWSYALENANPASSAVRSKVVLTESPLSVMEPAVAIASKPAATSALSVNWVKLGVGGWLCGVLALGLHSLGIRWWLTRLARRSRVTPAERWQHLASDVPPGVEVRESTECRVPMAVGVWKPVVLLPSAALEWSEERLSAALQHEFGHVRRRDCLSRLLLEVACAIYWVNPLMWIAARAMRVAQEQACDDLVLRAGANAEEYATQLVEVVRGLSPAGFVTPHALAMAQPSTPRNARPRHRG